MRDSIRLNKFGLMLDCSRNAVMKPEAVKKYIDILSDLGYNCLMLYTEDTYEIDGEPYFGHKRGRYSQVELIEIDSYAKLKGIELIPCIQTLAHLGSIFRWPCYDKIHDCNDILLSDNDETYCLIDKMFATLKRCFTSRTVNIGMDEAHMLGRGKYQDINGYVDRFDILLKHLNCVAEIAQKYGFELIMWGDMFFRILNQASGGGYENGTETIPEKVRSMIPDNVNLIYWDYYSVDKQNYCDKIKSHSALKENIWFAGGLWTWLGFAPHNDFSIRATEAAFSACAENGVKDIILTVWGDDGGECSRFSILPSLFYASEIAKGNYDIDSIKTNFKAKFKIGFDEFMALDLLKTPNKNQGTVSCDKFFFYNDCFTGLCDTLVMDDYFTCYTEQADELEKLAINTEYGVLFNSLSKLCRVLALKTDLGIRTRKAYESKDKEKIKQVTEDYDKLLLLIEDFYTAYEKQWMWENKPHGFDIQDIRIGGLLMRIRHNKQRLLQYVNGDIDRIEELEEPALDVICRPENEKGHIYYNVWSKIASANIFKD